MNKRTRLYNFFDENLDEYFIQAIDNMTVEQKQRLPSELSAKILRGGKDCLDSLLLDQKLFILTVILGKKWTFFIEDEYGMSYEAFLELQKSYTENSPRRDSLTQLREMGSFFLGSTSLMRRLEYVSLQFANNIYKSIVGYRVALHEKRRKVKAQREVSYSVNGVIRFIINYEMNKFKVISTYGLNSISELYTLLFFYEDENKAAKFHEVFLYAYSTGRSHRNKALARLLELGYIDTRAKKHTIHIRYYLTPKGRELAIKIIDKLFFNY